MLNTLLPQKELNPDFWPNGVEGKIAPDIRYNLLKTAKSFQQSWDLSEVGLDKKLKLVDCHFTGSLANFNWSKYSDIDLHIKVDFSDIDAEYLEAVKGYLLAQKNIYNLSHKITIKGFEVEVYPEDINLNTVSTGIYSLFKDEWVIEPKYHEVSPNQEYILRKTQNIIGLVDYLVSLENKIPAEQSVHHLDYLTKKLKKMRQSGLSKDGEFAEDNLVFKLLRRLGYLDKIWDLKNLDIDKSLTLESKEWKHPLADYLDGNPTKEEHNKFMKEINPTGKKGTNRALTEKKKFNS